MSNNVKKKTSKYETAGGLERPNKDHPYSSPMQEYIFADAKIPFSELAERWGVARKSMEQASQRGNWREKREQHQGEHDIVALPEYGLPVKRDDIDKVLNAIKLWHEGTLTINQMQAALAATGLAAVAELVGSNEKSLRLKAAEILVQYGLTKPALLSDHRLRLESETPAALFAALRQLSGDGPIDSGVAALIGESSD